MTRAAPRWHVGVVPMTDRLDDEYLEYLWGEPTPRTFAQKARVDRAKGNVNSKVSRFVSR